MRFNALLLIGGLAASIPAAPTIAAEGTGERGEGAFPVALHTEEANLQDQIDSAVVAARIHMQKVLASDEFHTRSDAFREARTLNEPWIAEIALPQCGSPDLTVRSIALEVVAASNPSVGRQAFLLALKSDERTIRLRGLLGLERLADESTIPDVVEILIHDPDPDLREVAARTLGAIKSPVASDPLIEALESDIPAVREQAVLSLVAIDESGLSDTLLERLNNLEFPGEVNLLRMLALIPDPSLVPLIEPYLNSGSEEVQTSAAAAIFEILERSGYAPR